jgi:hypothetical protein
MAKVLLILFFFGAVADGLTVIAVRAAAPDRRFGPTPATLDANN